MKLSLGFHLRKQRRFEEANRAIEQTVALEQGLGPKSRPKLLRYWTYYGLMLERQDQQRRALDSYRRALPIALEGAAADADSTSTRLEVSIAKGHVAMQMARLGQPKGNARIVDDAIHTLEGLYAADPTQTFYRNILLAGYGYQAELQYLLGNQSEAFNLYHKSLDIAEQLSQSDPTDLESRISIIKLHHALAVVLARERRYSEALQEENMALARVTEYLKVQLEDPEALMMAEAVRSSLRDLPLCSEG